MKKFLIAMLSLAAVVPPLCAQSVRTSEQPRYSVRPYAGVEEAAAGDTAPSRYIVPITEWTREESGGKVRFTSEFVYPAAWLNRQILLRTESASSGFAVEVEGQSAGEVTNGAVPAEFNITKLSKTGINKLTIIMDAPSQNEPLLRGGVSWIGRAEIVSQPTVRVRDIDTQTILNDSGDGIFEVAIMVKSDALNAKQARISYELTDSLERITGGYKDVKLSMRGEDTVRFVAIVPKARLWRTDSPTLLTLTVRNRIEGRYAENIVIPIGAREIRYDGKSLRVNGEAVTLRVKSVAPNITVEDLERVKSEGFNAVTVAAGEAASGLYSACDIAGVYVIPQMAVDTSNGGRSIKKGGNASNDPSLTEEYLWRAAEMYHTSKSHPSVVAFSLGGGITNGINPYEAYLLLKGLDSVRPVIYEGAGKEWNNDVLN